jgi:plastocyanin
MRRPAIVYLCFLFISSFFLASCTAQNAHAPQASNPQEIPTLNPTTMPGVLPHIGLPVTSQGTNIQIDILDDVFQPNEVTIPVGYTVTWVNRGHHSHTVTADSGTFASHALQPGSTYQFTFTKAGSYDYFCEFHGEAGRRGMYGIITVAAGSTPVAGITISEH